MKVTVIAGNGIGGTEKAAFHYAAELSKRGHEVCALTSPTGPRTHTLLGAGVRIDPVPYGIHGIKQHLETFRPDIVHQHVPGYGDHRPLYHALDQMGGEKPRIIETNVFGRLMDRHDHGHVSFRMFVSRASGCQAFGRPRISRQTPDISKHAILSNPLPPYLPPCGSRRAEIRSDLGITDQDFLILRLGRPMGKWTSWDCEAFAKARRRNPHLRLLLMEPPPELVDKVRAGKWGPDILISKATSDFQYLSDLYGSADAMLHASNFGESYGYTLAEAMQAGLPVVTLSTPWGDNAQVELVSHRQSGFICCSARGMAQALLDLSADPKLRTQMGAVAKDRIAQISDSERDTSLLEGVMHLVTGDKTGTLLQERFAEWMAYRDHSFEADQNNLYERDRGMTVAVLRWKAYCKYRAARSGTRHTMDILRNRFTSKAV